MKRIIIPAGAISAKVDYILELPIEPNANDDEDAVYIVDEKLSKTSMINPSDYIYDEKYQELRNPNSTGNYYQDQFYPEPKGSFVNNRDYTQRQKDAISRYEDYLQYCKSLGYSQSEIDRFLSMRNSETRKFSKFNTLGVSDFLAPITNYGNGENPDAQAASENYDSYCYDQNEQVCRRSPIVKTNRQYATGTGHSSRPISPETRNDTSYADQLAATRAQQQQIYQDETRYYGKVNSPRVSKEKLSENESFHRGCERENYATPPPLFRPKTGTMRRLPGTSVISNVPEVKLRNTNEVYQD